MKKLQKPANRIAKVNSLIEHVLGPVLHETLQGENGLLTISKVETSKDMKWAKIWVSILGGDDAHILKILENNIFEIQGRLNGSMNTKIFPRISFHLDTSPRYVEHVDKLIRKIHEEEK
ncbi:MAG: ribosome-binding factor A [Candidatus Doudnabacteria bacterium]|nr:ribosome-binding factor A [Candidatus Doudnabacteria bacterium]